VTARRSAPPADRTAGQDRPPEDRQGRRGLLDPQVHRALPGHQDLEARRDHPDLRDPQALLGRQGRVLWEPRAHPDRRPGRLAHPVCRAGEEAPAGALEVETPAEGQADVEEW
jgi:hypothetical protein